MNRAWRSILTLSFALLISGCFGRIDDGNGQKIDAKAYGLDGVRPALIVFGAGWCKPCLAEIPALNRAQRELGADLQIVNFLVEGKQKGSPAAPDDQAKLQSPKGEKPEYTLQLDPSWTLFDQINPPSGRALPTMVFVGWDQSVARVVQRSMEYESELLPVLQALVAGKPVQEEPGKQPDEDQGQMKSMTFAEFTATPGNEPGGSVYTNFQAAGHKGLEEYAFLEEDMPFNRAKMTVTVFENGSIVPKVGVWDAFMTGCKLTVFTNPDGTFLRSEGICR
jgi:thiol-disulfide isomerase/thioredoxin